MVTLSAAVVVVVGGYRMDFRVKNAGRNVLPTSECKCFRMMMMSRVFQQFSVEEPHFEVIFVEKCSQRLGRDLNSSWKFFGKVSE